MANNNTYDGPTLTLSVKDTSYDNLIYQPTKPVLDSELNFMGDLASAKLQDFIRSKIPSGWLDASFSKGSDNNGNLYGINTTSEPNTFVVSSTKQTPLIANVNGWLLQVGGYGVAEDNKLKIVLPDAPSSSSRSDLVFLEVWKVALDGNSTDNKPGSTLIHKFGNTQYEGTNLEDEIINPSMNFKTTKRVQIQYRLRIIQGPDFVQKPEGVDDQHAVNAQGAKTSPISGYAFTNAGATWDDYGLYTAGNGSTASRDDLGTVDGYVYAIPMFRIHRRNKGAFSTANQNGASYSMTSGLVSDRPDGLYYDQVSVYDIEDLRHSVSFSTFNYQEILDKNLDEVFSGSYSHILSRSALEGNLESTGKGLYINRIATSSVPNTDLLRSPAVPQRYFSDVAGIVPSVISKTTSNKTVGNNGSDWITSDQFSITVPPEVSRSSCVIHTTTPVVRYAQTSSGPFSTVTGTWSGLGTATATFTFGSNGASLTNQNLYISYELSYSRIGDKLTKPISEMLKVQDNKRNEDWGFISVTDFDNTVLSNQRRRKRNITPRVISSSNPDFAYVYRLNKTLANYGMSTIYSYHVNATGTSTVFTIPADIINAGDAAYVHSVYNINTQSYVSITTSQRQTNGTITVTLPSALTALLRFDIAVIGGVIEYDQRTQSIVDMGRVDFYSIMGNGTSQVVLKGGLVDPTEIIVGAQTVYGYQNDFTVKTACYVNGILTMATATVEANSSLIMLSFATAIPTTSKIEVALLAVKTLDSTEDLNIYYNYSEYKGITSKVNFGTSSSSYVNSQVLFHRNKLDIVTNGTGAINTSEHLSASYEPLIPKLPIINSADYGNFTGTTHTSREIIGGSYSATTTFNTPYACGKVNYLSKNGVVQNKGTNSGGRFIVSAESGEASIHKLIVGSTVEMVKEDGTKNFLPGEVALRIETNYLNNTATNRVSNSTGGETTNSFDLYKVEGRPLIKLNSK